MHGHADDRWLDDDVDILHVQFHTLRLHVHCPKNLCILIMRITDALV
jgi:hypothetical protein